MEDDIEIPYGGRYFPKQKKGQRKRAYPPPKRKPRKSGEQRKKSPLTPEQRREYALKPGEEWLKANGTKAVNARWDRRRKAGIMTQGEFMIRTKGYMIEDVAKILNVAIITVKKWRAKKNPVTIMAERAEQIRLAFPANDQP